MSKINDILFKHDLSITQGQLEETQLSNSIAFVKLAENEIIDEVTASEHADLFNEWQSDIAYQINDIRKYEGSLYKCLQAHTSQETWNPSLVPALWKKIGDPTVEFPEWSQPIGAQDCYMAGDKVTYNNKHYVSNTDNNVWCPAVFGWDEI